MGIEKKAKPKEGINDKTKWNKKRRIMGANALFSPYHLLHGITKLPVHCPPYTHTSSNAHTHIYTHIYA